MRWAVSFLIINPVTAGIMINGAVAIIIATETLWTVPLSMTAADILSDETNMIL